MKPPSTQTMPPLQLGKRTARLPIVQGGMAVRISLGPLAAAVAEAGGVGTIALSGLSVDEARREIRWARERTDGVLAVNVMVAVRMFKELVQAAIHEGIDVVIAGAGFSRDVFGWCKEAGVAIVPVIGAPRVAKLAERFGADAVVLEGVEAGGHLGADAPMRELLPDVLDAVDIPVIAAGGIVTGADIAEVLEVGAAGVQMGTRFAATAESSAPEGFKRMYVEAGEDDVVLVNSPVGLPGRALRNRFVDELHAGRVPSIDRCIACLKKCGKDYCIVERLEDAQRGDVVDGLVFAGSCVSRVHDIPTAGALVARLEEEYARAALAREEERA